jgi:hypothetical protein
MSPENQGVFQLMKVGSFSWCIVTILKFPFAIWDAELDEILLGI